MREHPLVDTANAIVVHEKPRNVHFLFGFLAVAFALALVRGYLGAETDKGRIVVTILFTVLLLGTLATWRLVVRNPAHLEITHDAIRVVHRNGKVSQEMRRASGVLMIANQMVGRHAQPVLRQDGVDESIFSWTYNAQEIKQGALAMGWHWQQ